MNSRALLKAIHETNTAIAFNKQKLTRATDALVDAITPPDPYVYMMPIVAFFIGLRYADPLAKLISFSSMYRYGLLLMPLLKE